MNQVIKELNRAQCQSLKDHPLHHCIGFFRKNQDIVIVYTIIFDDEENKFEYGIQCNYGILDDYDYFDTFDECYKEMMSALINSRNDDLHMIRWDINWISNLQNNYWKYILKIEEEYQVAGHVF